MSKSTNGLEPGLGLTDRIEGCLLGAAIGIAVQRAGRGVDWRFPVLAALLTLAGSLASSIVVDPCTATLSRAPGSRSPVRAEVTWKSIAPAVLSTRAKPLMSVTPDSICASASVGLPARKGRLPHAVSRAESKASAAGATRRLVLTCLNMGKSIAR